MRTLKMVYLLFAAWSIASAILGVSQICAAQDHTAAMNHAVFRTISAIFASAFCGAAIYGIHNKSIIAWKIGWGVIAAGLIEFLASALSATSRIPRTDYPGVAAVVVAGLVVALYWSYWWNKQKCYFIKSTPANESRE
jgi:peptidoglycan/LPS O-acetylase OafA/YrhL